jgi:hypothetical protein
MHDMWEIPTANTTYTKSQNNVNMVVGEHGIQAFIVVVVTLLLLWLLFGVFVPISTHPLLIMGNWFV